MQNTDFCRALCGRIKTDQGIVLRLKAIFMITLEKLADDILKNYPKFDSQILNGELIDNNIIALIRKSIDKDPDKRFSSAKEMYDHWKTINL